MTAINTFGATGLLSCLVSAGSTYYAFDERGNVVQRTNSAGTVTSSDLYDGFGKLAAGGTVGDAWGFGAQAGYYTDGETGLPLLTHRYYDPSTGRFLTRDPISFNGGINLYGYVGNDPLAGIDPFGYDGFSAGVIGGIVGITIAVVLTGGIAIIPVAIGGVVGGAIGGYFFGGTPNHAADAGEGAIGGGFVACVVIFRTKPPLFPPRPTPPVEPIPPDKIWPPPPNVPN